MASVVQFYGMSFIVNDVRLFSGTTVTQFPSVQVKLARLKAWTSNIGSFFVGESASDLFFELDAGDDTGWISLSNLNQLWFSNGSGTADKLAVWLQY